MNKIIHYGWHVGFDWYINRCREGFTQATSTLDLKLVTCEKCLSRKLEKKLIKVFYGKNEI